MPSILSKIPNHRLLAGILLLAVPAFLLNLGLPAFIGDECIRSLVAFEMHHSGHYIVPTLNGEHYFKKPPLYNWFLLVAARLWGGFGEWPARLTTLFFLGSYAGAVYYFTKKYLTSVLNAQWSTPNDQQPRAGTQRSTFPFGFLAAFILLTCGRILFWDSMLGLIDICFSAVIFLNFMLLYALGRQGRWGLLFLVSYLLTAVAFLLKGMPAAVFQAISLPVALALHSPPGHLWTALRKRLFSGQHVLGALPGLAIVVAYYAAVAQRQDLPTVFAILLDQSMQRTPTGYSVVDSLLQVLKFPFEQTYHFLPWSLLAVACFRRDFRQRLRENDFVRFNFWMLAANLPVYWVSAGTYPRYLLMFVPLFTVVCLYMLKRGERGERGLGYVFIGISAVAAVGAWVSPLLSAQARGVAGFWPTWVACSVGLTLCAVAMYADRRRLLLWLVAALLWVRIALDVVVLPLRLPTDHANLPRADMARLAQKWGDRSWWIYDQTQIHEVARFYSANALGQIIYKTTRTDHPHALYIVDKELYPDFPGTTVDSLQIESERKLPLILVDGGQ